MERDVQTSFIPKQSLSIDARPKETVGLFLLLSIVVLIIALLFLGGAYGYRFYLTNEINRPCASDSGNELDSCGLLASLEKSKQSLGNESISEFELLDKQLRRAGEIVNEHKTFLPVFQFLEDETLQSVRYTSLNQTGTTLDLKGVAKSYEGVALQSIEFFEQPQVVENFLFSDVNADATGNVGFSLKLTLNPSLFSYVKNLAL